MRILLTITSLFLLLATVAQADEADVLAVKARPGSAGSWHFDVTLRHEDTGWDHYADRWQILTIEGDILGTRVLLHPHVNEQPFTRSLGGVAIPAEVKRVRVRAHDSQHELGGVELEVELSR